MLDSGWRRLAVKVEYREGGGEFGLRRLITEPQRTPSLRGRVQTDGKAPRHIVSSTSAVSMELQDIGIWPKMKAWFLTYWTDPSETRGAAC